MFGLKKKFKKHEEKIDKVLDIFGGQLAFALMEILSIRKQLSKMTRIVTCANCGCAVIEKDALKRDDRFGHFCRSCNEMLDEAKNAPLLDPSPILHGCGVMPCNMMPGEVMPAPASTPVYQYTVYRGNGTDSVTITASRVNGCNGEIIFQNADGDVVAAFAAGNWSSFDRSEIEPGEKAAA